MSIKYFMEELRYRINWYAERKFSTLFIMACAESPHHPGVLSTGQLEDIAEALGIKPHSLRDRLNKNTAKFTIDECIKAADARALKLYLYDPKSKETFSLTDAYKYYEEETQEKHTS